MRIRFPPLARLPAGRFYRRQEFPLFGKWFDEAHHAGLVEGEGLGEILKTIFAPSYEHYNNYNTYVHHFLKFNRCDLSFFNAKYFQIFFLTPLTNFPKFD